MSNLRQVLNEYILVYYGSNLDLIPLEKYLKYKKLYNAEFHWHSGSVLECPLCVREVAGSIPGQVIPKTLKMVLADLSFGTQH